MKLLFSHQNREPQSRTFVTLFEKEKGFYIICVPAYQLIQTADTLKEAKEIFVSYVHSPNKTPFAGTLPPKAIKVLFETAAKGAKKMNKQVKFITPLAELVTDLYTLACKEIKATEPVADATEPKATEPVADPVEPEADAAADATEPVAKKTAKKPKA